MLCDQIFCSCSWFVWQNICLTCERWSRSSNFKSSFKVVANNEKNLWHIFVAMHFWWYNHFSEIHFHLKWLRCTFPETSTPHTFPKIGQHTFLPLVHEPKLFLQLGDEPNILRKRTPWHSVKVKSNFGESEFQWYGPMTVFFNERLVKTLAVWSPNGPKLCSGSA